MFNVPQGQELLYLRTSVTPIKKFKLCSLSLCRCIIQYILRKVEQVLSETDDPELGKGAEEGRKLREQVVVEQEDLQPPGISQGRGEINQ